MSSGVPARPSGVWSMENFDQVRIVGAVLRVERRFDEAGADGVDAYAVLAELDGERAGESEHGAACSCRPATTARQHGTERTPRSRPLTILLPWFAPSGSRKARVTLNGPSRSTASVSGQSLATASASRGKGVAADDAGIVDQDRDRAELALRPRAASRRQAGRSLTSRVKGAAPCRRRRESSAAVSAASPLMSRKHSARPRPHSPARWRGRCRSPRR